MEKRKPVLVFSFNNGIPEKEERVRINNLIKTPELEKDYHIFLIFNENNGQSKETKVTLLQKGRNTKTITNKMLKQWKLSIL